MINPLKKRILLCINVSLLMLAAWLAVLSSQESALYRDLVRSVLGESPLPTEQARVLALLKGTHAATAEKRALIPAEAKAPALKRWFDSADYALLYPSGACGDFSKAFVVAAHTAGIKARIAHLKKDGLVHHVGAEAFVEGRWVYVDPLYGFAFARGDRLATVEEIRTDWATLKLQAPPAFQRRGYRFDTIERTNWRKIPVVMPIVRSVLAAVAGETWAAELSLRTYVLRVYRVLLFGIAGLLVLVNLLARTRRASGFRPPAAEAP